MKNHLTKTGWRFVAVMGILDTFSIILLICGVFGFLTFSQSVRGLLIVWFGIGALCSTPAFWGPLSAEERKRPEKHWSIVDLVLYTVFIAAGVAACVSGVVLMFRFFFTRFDAFFFIFGCILAWMCGLGVLEVFTTIKSYRATHPKDV